MKTCSKCNTKKELTEFYKRSKDVYRSVCKKCDCARVKLNSIKRVKEKAAYDKKYREVNAEEIRIKKRAWDKKHYQLRLSESKNEDPKTKITKRCSRCKEVTSDFKRNVGKKDGFDYCCRNCQRKTDKKWRLANKGKRKEYYREYRQSNKDKINKRESERRRDNPAIKVIQNMRSHMVSILNGTAKCASQMELLGCTREHYLQHMEAQFTEGMTWDNYGEWHQDHIQPCASFDQTDPEQQKICWHYTNFQPLWAAENIQKRDSIVPEHQVSLL